MKNLPKPLYAASALLALILAAVALFRWPQATLQALFVACVLTLLLTLLLEFCHDLAKAWRLFRKPGGSGVEYECLRCGHLIEISRDPATNLLQVPDRCPNCEEKERR